MTRELIILRHAKSDWDDHTLRDFDRPLAPRGRKAAPKIGHWLNEQGLIPDAVVSSPAVRAKQTAQRVCPEVGFDVNNIIWDTRIYEASLGQLLVVLADLAPTQQRVLLVGHNPGLENLLTYLSAAQPDPNDGKLLPTTTAAQVELPDDWRELSPGCGRLVALQRPRGLP